MRNEMEYLTGNDKQLLAGKSSHLTFSKDQMIIEEGAPSRAVYFLREGTARVYRVGMNPDTRLATLRPGDVCGEMAFLERALQQAPRSSQTSTWLPRPLTR